MKIKCLVIGVILILVSFNVSGFIINDTWQFESPIWGFKGNILYVGGSDPGNYSNIQDAIDNASSGDTVFVYNGVYEGGLVIDKSIILQGENREFTIIDGVAVNEQNGVSIIGDGVHLSGFTLRNIGKFWPESAVYINAYDTVICNNIITDNKFGIDVYESENTKIQNNLIVNQNRYDGIYVRFSSYNTISNNVISDNNGYGLILVESPYNLIFENSISNSNWGGLAIQDEINVGNIIYHNNFFGNIPQNAWDVGDNFWNDSYPSGGNFWDDYEGVDEDGDGIGDIPYYINGGDSKDFYPLMMPFVTNDTQIQISSVSGTPFKINAVINNVGNYIAVDVDWSISFEGGLVFFNRESIGNFDYLFYKDSKVISSNSFIGFGNSKLVISAKASNSDIVYKEVEVFLFFIFVFIK